MPNSPLRPQMLFLNRFYYICHSVSNICQSHIRMRFRFFAPCRTNASTSTNRSRSLTPARRCVATTCGRQRQQRTYANRANQAYRANGPYAALALATERRRSPSATSKCGGLPSRANSRGARRNAGSGRAICGNRRFSA